MLAAATLTKEDEHIASRASKSVRSLEADFLRAQAHSVKVRVLKWSLPVLGLGLALTFGVYTFLSRVPQLSYDLASVAYADGKLVMSNPKLNGVTKDNLPYAMTAARAIQNPANPALVELEDVNATIPVDTRITATIVASRAAYNTKANILAIRSPFTVVASNGLNASLDTAVIEIDKGKMVSKRPVEITMDGNKITADSMSILEQGDAVVFEKRVRLTLKPGALGPDGNSGDQKNAAN